MPDNNEVELIAQALKGDQKAYTYLTEKHWASVRQIVYKIVRNRETADDLVQETFMKAYASLASFRTEYRFSTWLYKIAANSSIDYLRKKRIKALSLDRPLETSNGTVEIECVQILHLRLRDLFGLGKGYPGDLFLVGFAGTFSDPGRFPDFCFFFFLSGRFSRLDGLILGLGFWFFSMAISSLRI